MAGLKTRAKRAAAKARGLGPSPLPLLRYEDVEKEIEAVPYPPPSEWTKERCKELLTTYQTNMKNAGLPSTNEEWERLRAQNESMRLQMEESKAKIAASTARQLFYTNAMRLNSEWMVRINSPQQPSPLGEDSQIAKDAIRSRYDWSPKLVPKWVRFIATDEIGIEWGFLDKPHNEVEGCWMEHPMIFLKHTGSPCSDWKNTLEERPDES